MERWEKADLQAVWRRVAPELDPYPEERKEPDAAADQGVQPGKALCLALEAAQAARRGYLAYAGQSAGSTRRALEDLARGSGLELRRLRGLYYLLTGERWEAQRCCADAEKPGLCAFLRSMYAAEASSAARYEAWAGEAGDACLSGTLRQMAGESRGRAESVLRLLENRLAP